MGMQTQIYFTDEDSLKAHEAWAKYLRTINKDGAQVTLSDFIKEVFFFVVKNDQQFSKFLDLYKKESPEPEKKEEPKKEGNKENK